MDHAEAQLAQIREISQNARAAWFALLALLAFVGVVMMAHEDADFFAAGVSTTLPIFAVEVPTVAFFIAAPLLIAAFYIYLHVYLTSLWDAIADAPSRVAGDRLLDRAHPTLLAQTAVLYRAARRRDGSAPTRAFRGAMLALAILLVWLTSPALLAVMFWSSAAHHDPRLTGLIGLCLAVASLFGWEGLRVARGVLSGGHRGIVHAPWGWPGRAAAGGLLLLALLATGLMTLGSQRMGLDRDEYGLGPVAADLREAELTRRPPDWRSWPLWMEDFEQRWRAREDLPPGTPLGARESALRAEAAERYADFIDSLDAPDLRGDDLRGANLALAFLPGADLRGAEMQGARLNWAEMQGADLGGAEMQGANLFQAEMQGADLRRAEMQETILWRAEMQRANLGAAEMQGALLFRVEMQEAILRGAEMRGAFLREAEMQGASLFEADMHGADLHGAEMQSAVLIWAEMQGAVLRAAEMTNADCLAAAFHGAAAQGATLLCRSGTLTARALENAVGDEETRLPKGLTLPTCLARAEADLPEALRAAIARHPEQTAGVRTTRAQFLDLLVCDEGETPETIVGSWVPRGDGAWIDEATGNVWAEHSDGDWRETPPEEAPPLAHAGPDDGGGDQGVEDVAPERDPGEVGEAEEGGVAGGEMGDEEQREDP